MKRMLLLTLATIFMAVGGSAAAPVIGDYDTLWNKALSNIVDFKFHPSGNTVFVTQNDNEFLEIDALTGEIVYKYSHPDESVVLSRPRHFDVNNSGSQVASIHFDTVFIWDYQTKNIIKRIYFDSYAVFFGNNDKFLFGLKNQTEPFSTNFWVYDIENDRILKEAAIFLQGYIYNVTNKVLATSPDGKYFALAENIEINGEDKHCIAVFNAQTLEKIIDLPSFLNNGYGEIVEITFSQNSKWLACRGGDFTIKLLNFEKYLQDQSIEEKEFSFVSRPSFLGTDKYILLGSHYPIPKTYIINLETNDTTYYINYQLYHISANSNNHLIIGQRSSHHTVMLNTNWYTVGVTEPDTASVISTLNYLNSVLTYTLSISNPASIVISNSIGNIIFTTENVMQNGTIELSLSSGAYFFTVSNGNKSYTKQFWVVR